MGKPTSQCDEYIDNISHNFVTWYGLFLWHGLGPICTIKTIHKIGYLHKELFCDIYRWIPSQSCDEVWMFLWYGEISPGDMGGIFFCPSGFTKREFYRIKDNIVFKLIYG